MRAVTTRLTAAVITLLAGLTLGHAQTTQDQTAQGHDAHHPEAQAQGAKPGRPMAPSGRMQGGPGMGAATGMGMGTMMGGNMEQMMPMMQMMQNMQMMNGMMSRDGNDGMPMLPGRHVEGRIAYLKAELGITEAQLPQWNAFADAMRAGATAMQTAMAANMAPGVAATAPARSDAMIAMMSSRLDAMKSTSAAGKALYAVLTDTQKKTADELMMSRMAGVGGR